MTDIFSRGKIHAKTIERLEKDGALDVIDNMNFAPMYRNRQKLEPELFAFSVKLAKKKNSPKRYFATIWAKRNLKKSIEWLRKLVNTAKNRAMVEYQRKIKLNREAKVDVNSAGLDRLQALKRANNFDLGLSKT